MRARSTLPSFPSPNCMSARSWLRATPSSPSDATKSWRWQRVMRFQRVIISALSSRPVGSSATHAHSRLVSRSWDLCWPHPRRRQAGRPAGPATDQIRSGDQSKDREGARFDGATVDPRPRRRGNRIAAAFRVNGRSFRPKGPNRFGAMAGVGHESGSRRQG